MMIEEIVFDNFEILNHHIPPLFSQIEDLLSECDSSSGEISKLMNSLDGQKINSAYLNHIQEISFQTNEITPPKETVLSISNINSKSQHIICKIDYITNWLYQAELQLKSFESRPPLLDISWGIRLTQLTCSLFINICKVLALLQTKAKHLSFVWFCYRAMGAKNPLISTPVSFINQTMRYLFKHPFNYFSDNLPFLITQFSALTFQLSSTMSQILTLYTTFDWTILAPETNDSTLSGTKSVSSPQLTILRNLHLFCETLTFFAICFPTFFAEKVQLSALISNVFTECVVIEATKQYSLKLSSMIKLCKMQLPATIINNIDKDADIKRDITHPARLRFLVGLFTEYIEHFNVSPQFLPLFTEKILSAFGYAFAELMSCLMNNIDSQYVYELLASISTLFNALESEEKEIQRTFLFTLRTIDQNYMNDLIKMFGRIRTNEDKEFVNIVNNFTDALTMLDLESFDEGMRYDFTAFAITHGRIIARIINKSTNELPYFKPLLDQLQNIILHSELVESPISLIRRICSFSSFDKLISKVNDYIKSSQSVASSLNFILPLLRIFRMFTFSEDRGETFCGCCENYIKRIISPISDSISMQSRNIQVARQSAFDGGFKPEAFMPFFDPANSDNYSIEANLINKVGCSLKCVKQLPAILVYGTKVVELRDLFKKEFMLTIYKKLIDVQYQPLIVNSTLTTISQLLRPFFNYLGIPFSKTILTQLQKATPLENEGSIKLQASLFDGTSRLENPTSFLKFYTDELKKFIATEHCDARYEPLGRRFVSTSSNKSYSYELFFGFQPMLYIVQTFGIKMGAYIDCFLMRLAFQQLTILVRTYESIAPKLTVYYQEFRNSMTVQASSPIPPESIKMGATSLLSFGLIIALRDMLNSAVVEVTESALPGFQDFVQSAYARTTSASNSNSDPASNQKTNNSSNARKTTINKTSNLNAANLNPKKKKLNDTENAFLEAASPGLTNKYFKVRAESIVKTALDPGTFFFFLGLLNGYSGWQDLGFDIENDLFTPNLQLVANALDKIIDLADVIFTGATNLEVQKAIHLYFTTVASICNLMKAKGGSVGKSGSSSYAAFVILVDHFPSLTSNILYGHMEEAFPYSVIRACYNEVAQQYRSDPRRASVAFDCE